MAAKTNKELLLKLDTYCEEAEKLAIEEACQQPLPFMASLGILNYNECVKIIKRLPARILTEEQHILLYGLTDAIITNFAHPSEGSSMFNKSSLGFLKLVSYLEARWKVAFSALCQTNKPETSEATENRAACLMRLLLDCHSRLSATDCPNALLNVLSAGQQTLAKIIARRSNQEELEPSPNKKHGFFTKCTCIMCQPSYKEEPSERIWSSNVDEDEKCVEKSPLAKKLPVIKVLSPSKLLSPSKIVEQVTPQEKKGAPMLSSLGQSSTPPISASPMKNSISASPMKNVHGSYCFCDICLTPPEEKAMKAFSTKVLTPKRMTSTKLTNENSASAPKPAAQTKTITEYMKPGPAVKRPLFPSQEASAAKKPCLQEKSLLPNGKVNAFAFMMKASSTKK